MSGGNRLTTGWMIIVGAGLGATACTPYSSGQGNAPLPTIVDGTSTGDLEDETGTEPDMDPAGTSGMGSNTDGGDDDDDDDGGPVTDGGPPAAEESGGEPEPTEQILEHHDFSACENPLWCSYYDNIDEPIWQQQWMQECFEAELPSPFVLREFEFYVWGYAGDLDDLSIEVHGNDGTGPGVLLAEQEFDPDDLKRGLNTIVLDPPLVIDQQDICVGIASPNPEGALGISMSATSFIDDASYFQLDSWGGCNVHSWTDVTDVQSAELGNLCMRATIETM